MKCGVGVKPKTDIETVLPYIDDIDMVLVMTVCYHFLFARFN